MQIMSESEIKPHIDAIDAIESDLRIRVRALGSGRVASAGGIHVSSVCQWLSGARNMRPEVLLKIESGVNILESQVS